jgi:hypothetical protein
MLSHFVKFWLTCQIIIFVIFYGCPVPDLRVKNVLSNSNSNLISESCRPYVSLEIFKLF